MVAKRSNRAVSQVLNIKDDYVSFCLDEAAEYVYQQWEKGAKTKIKGKNKNMSGNQFMKTLAKPKVKL